MPPWHGAQLKESTRATLPLPLCLPLPQYVFMMCLMRQWLQLYSLLLSYTKGQLYILHSPLPLPLHWIMNHRKTGQNWIILDYIGPIWNKSLVSPSLPNITQATE